MIIVDGAWELERMKINRNKGGPGVLDIRAKAEAKQVEWYLKSITVIHHGLYY